MVLFAFMVLPEMNDFRGSNAGHKCDSPRLHHFLVFAFSELQAAIFLRTFCVRFLGSRLDVRLSDLWGVSRPRVSPRDAIRARKTLGGGSGSGELTLILNLSQFFAQAGGFGVILCRLETEPEATDAAHGIDDLGDTTTAIAGMFELVG